MRIAMIGQKGVPAKQGGVERHVEELSARLVEMGHEVTVFTRPNYTDPKLESHRGITLKSLPTVGTKHLDAIVHSVISSLVAAREDFDVVHYHAIGPCLASPVSRVAGKSVVATIHARDWQRAKWGTAATYALRVAEKAALTVPNKTISVSGSLAAEYADEGRDVVYIPNGVTIEPEQDLAVLEELGIEAGNYVVFAGRLVPEKGVHHLLAAWDRLGFPMPLVVVGDESHSGDYSETLHDMSAGAVFAGFRSGPSLGALFRNAALFVLPSDLEGLPIVLLEAVAYGVPVLASDIPPNKEILGDKGVYFHAGSVDSLTESLDRCLGDLDELGAKASAMRLEALEEYDWDRVAEATAGLYSELVGVSAHGVTSRTGFVESGESR